MGDGTVTSRNPLSGPADGQSPSAIVRYRAPGSGREGEWERSSAILVSRRAKGAPRQRCGPKPRPRCDFSSRVMSKRNGSGQREASRLAAARSVYTVSPSANWRRPTRYPALLGG